jgi:hypothetical protein
MITSINVTRPYAVRGVLRHKHRANIVHFHRDRQIELNPDFSQYMIDELDFPYCF